MNTQVDERDQILFWETDAAGTVNLSHDEGDEDAVRAEKFRQKVLATYLLGGTVLIRPGELFEGPENYYEEASSSRGLLRALLERGRAGLAMSRLEFPDLNARAKWAFQSGRVFDNGVLLDGDEAKRAQERTFVRAQELHGRGWKPAEFQQALTRDEHAERVTQISKNALQLVGKQFLGPRRLWESEFGKFIQSSAIINTRTDVLDRIPNWSKAVSEPKRERFADACREAHSHAMVVATASRYGGYVSELRPDTFAMYAVGASGERPSSQNVEWRVLEAFKRVLKNSLKPSETESGQPLVAAIASRDMHGIVSECERLVTAEDRSQLRDFLYQGSDRLDGKSLVEWVVETAPDDDVLAQYANHRLEDMEKSRSRRRNILSTLLGAAPGIVGDTILIILKSLDPSLEPIPPFSTTAIGSGLGYAYGAATGRPLFAGLRMPVRGI